MIKNPSNIYFQIAGYIIELKFGQTEQFFLKKKLVSEINIMYRGLIHRNSPQKIDYTINIVDQKTINLFKKKTFTFINFFEEKINLKEINTYYHIDIFQLSLLLRHILEKLLENKGFIMHASANIINNKVSVFLGPSGAGKSTIANLISAKYSKFADDSIVIKKEPAGYYVYRNPVFEKQNLFNDGNKRYQLGNLYLIKKAQYSKIVPVIKRGLETRWILSQLIVEKQNLNKRLKMIFDFTATFKGFNYLYFTKNKRGVLELFNKI